MELPLYEMTINPSADSDLEVKAIALVDSPAIEKNWFAFKENTNPLCFASVDDDEHIIIGAAMIPDLKIYRNDQSDGGLGEYNVFFSKQTVQQIAEKFYLKGFQANANIMHDSGQPAPGVNYFMSFIKDTAKGLLGLEGDYPEGTWFVGAKVDNVDVWAKIKSGEIKGFSVEGNFQFDAPQKEDKTLLEKIKNILNEIN